MPSTFTATSSPMAQNSRQNRNRKRKATLKLVKKAIADGKLGEDGKPLEEGAAKKGNAAKD